MLPVFVLIVLLSVFLPGSIIVLLVLNTAIGVMLSVLQILGASFPRFHPSQKTEKPTAFVTILVPAYNEPPAILIQTLDALSELEYDYFEVLVIDNNTKDESVWKPVENFVKKLGERFQFFHVDPLSGFKAGALNYVSKYSDPRSTFTIVIDADYVVDPSFINTALSYFVRDEIALVQFPQQYRNCTSENQPIADEYRHFFKVYMNMANHLNCVPSTGTVSVYRTSALKAIGGFRETALTEDADAGLRLHEAGYRGIYVDRSVGYGLMPYDIEAYRTQKKRWAIGNTQSIKKLFSLYGKIHFWSWIGFLSHLTVWDHLNFIPFTVLAAYVVVLIVPYIPTTGTHHTLLRVASISIFVTLLSRLTVFLISLHGQKHSVIRAIKAFIVHMGMTLMYSEALGSLLFQTLSTFERTNKFILSKMPNLIKNTYKEAGLGIWFLIGAGVAIYTTHEPLATAAFLVSAMALFSIYYVHWKILTTKEYSKKIITDLEEKYQPYLSVSSEV